MRALVIVGAGGFGRETVDVVRAINSLGVKWDLLGIIDDNPSFDDVIRLKDLSLPLLGNTRQIPPDANVAIGVGSPTSRYRLARTLSDRGHNFPALIHPSAIVGSSVRVGTGVIALASVSIGTNVTIGAHVHLNAHSVVGHDAKIEPFASINPNATVSGNCVIGTRSLLGASSTLLQGLSLGADSTVGAGSVVTKSVPDGRVVKGIPARCD